MTGRNFVDGVVVIFVVFAMTLTGYFLGQMSAYSHIARLAVERLK